jgi:hypothetical protein
MFPPAAADASVEAAADGAVLAPDDEQAAKTMAAMASKPEIRVTERCVDKVDPPIGDELAIIDGRGLLRGPPLPLDPTPTSSGESLADAGAARAVVPRIGQPASAGVKRM